MTTRDKEPNMPHGSTPTAENELILQGDCLALMAAMPEASVDAIVTDPPYGLGFMGKAWDALPPGEEWARACLRVLKPGGHLLAFGGTRTWHRLATAIEDAEFELRDSIAWLYGSGFPKSLDVSRAIDKAAGAQREVVGRKGGRAGSPRTDMRGGNYANPDAGRHLDLSAITAPATPEAEQWEGWGTALKPAFEPIVVARKPFVGPVAANVLEHGTGGLNIDGCRVQPASAADRAAYEAKCASVVGLGSNVNGDAYGAYSAAREDSSSAAGRWPANVVLDDWQAEILDAQSGVSQSRTGQRRGAASGEGWRLTSSGAEYTDRGGASRFFYVAKAPTKERPRVDGIAHPTVKPLTLMRWLVRLVTPPGGVVLDPFAGSGTTLEAAILEGFRPLGFELTEEYIPLIRARLARAAKAEGDLFGGVA